MAPLVGWHAQDFACRLGLVPHAMFIAYVQGQHHVMWPITDNSVVAQHACQALILGCNTTLTNTHLLLHCTTCRLLWHASLTLTLQCLPSPSSSQMHHHTFRMTLMASRQQPSTSSATSCPGASATQMPVMCFAPSRRRHWHTLKGTSSTTPEAYAPLSFARSSSCMASLHSRLGVWLCSLTAGTPWCWLKA